MFRGVQTLSMDSKGRISVPAKYRDVLSHLVIAPNPLMDDNEKCLWIYTYDEWESVEIEVSSKPNTKIFRQMKRFFLGGAVEYSLDGHSRVLLTPKLREFAQLNKKIVLVGQGNKLELWSQEAWDAQLNFEEDYLVDYQTAIESMSF